MDDVFEYLSCTDPYLYWREDDPETKRRDFQIFSEWAEAYCSDEPSEWLPVLDRNAKKSIPRTLKDIRERLKAADGEKLGETNLRLRQEDHDKLEQQYRDFEDDRIPGHVIGVYLTIPALFGRNESNANREECAELFEQVLEMGIAEDEVQRRFFGQYELYFETR